MTWTGAHRPRRATCLQFSKLWTAKRGTCNGNRGLVTKLLSEATITCRQGLEGPSSVVVASKISAFPETSSGSSDLCVTRSAPTAEIEQPQARSLEGQCTTGPYLSSVPLFLLPVCGQQVSSLCHKALKVVGSSKVVHVPSTVTAICSSAASSLTSAAWVLPSAVFLIASTIFL